MTLKNLVGPLRIPYSILFLGQLVVLVGSEISHFSKIPYVGLLTFFVILILSCEIMAVLVVILHVLLRADLARAI